MLRGFVYVRAAYRLSIENQCRRTIVWCTLTKNSLLWPVWLVTYHRFSTQNFSGQPLYRKIFDLRAAHFFLGLMKYYTPTNFLWHTDHKGFSNRVWNKCVCVHYHCLIRYWHYVFNKKLHGILYTIPGWIVWRLKIGVFKCEELKNSENHRSEDRRSEDG